MDWIEKITGVIASLLSFQTPERAIMVNILYAITTDSFLYRFSLKISLLATGSASFYSGRR